MTPEPLPADGLARSRPRSIFRILIADSALDLFRYKSFFLLIFVLILADRALKRTVGTTKGSIQLPNLRELSLQSARRVFEELPSELADLLTDYRTFVAIAALFLIKQLISMWPSSDMRRMHRQERAGFGLIGSLLILRWPQVVWDAVAVGSICAITFGWSALAFGLCRMIWTMTPGLFPLLLLAILVGLFLPIAMAGFSFSSKLAVIQRGGFGERLSLFFKLLLDPRLLWQSWLFFLARILVEAVFVIALPAAVLLTLDPFWLRILIAGALATPVYSYLKMVTFKFFLHAYRGYPLVRAEFSAYYGRNGSDTPAGARNPSPR